MIAVAEPCRQIEPLLSAHVDDELLADERHVVAHHLAGCADCAHRVEQLTVVRSLVRSLPVRRLPEGVGLPEPLLGAQRGQPSQAEAEAGAGLRSGPMTALTRAGAALAVTGGLLTGAAFSLGAQPPADTPTVAVPMDVYVADHFVHTVNRAVFTPIRFESQR